MKENNAMRTKQNPEVRVCRDCGFCLCWENTKEIAIKNKQLKN